MQEINNNFPNSFSRICVSNIDSILEGSSKNNIKNKINQISPWSYYQEFPMHQSKQFLQDSIVNQQNNKKQQRVFSYGRKKLSKKTLKLPSLNPQDIKNDTQRMIILNKVKKQLRQLLTQRILVKSIEKYLSIEDKLIPLKQQDQKINQQMLIISKNSVQQPIVLPCINNSLKKHSSRSLLNTPVSLAYRLKQSYSQTLTPKKNNKLQKQGDKIIKNIQLMSTQAQQQQTNGQLQNSMLKCIKVQRRNSNSHIIGQGISGNGIGTLKKKQMKLQHYYQYNFKHDILKSSILKQRKKCQKAYYYLPTNS